MKELIKLQVSETGNKTVSARELYLFLGIKEQFTDWIQRKIIDYDFTKDIEFRSFTEKSEKGGRPRIEYEITLEMAKELSMLENNEKGKEARKYFIKCEKEAKNNQLQLTGDISKQIAEIVQAQLKDQFKDQVDAVDTKYSQYIRPTALNKTQIVSYIKGRLGINKTNEEYGLVKKRIMIMLNAKKWEDIPIEKLQSSMSVVDECVEVIRKDRPYQQETMF